MDTVRMEAFLDSFHRAHPSWLEKLEEKARIEGIPVIRTATQDFLVTVLAFLRPGKVLEVGTAVGFSALLMCEYGPPCMQLTGIEQDPQRIRAARKNIADAGRSSQITLLEGDADQILPGLEDRFDLIFMDAAKAQYIRWLPDVKRLMHPGSILVSDNVLQGGEILESHFLVERRDRTIYRRMRDYLYELTHSPDLRTSILPASDGLALSVKL